MGAMRVGSQDDWISFEAAGRLIDGQNGWTFDHINRTRPRAEALVRLACDGVLKIRAESWALCLEGEAQDEISENDRNSFLFMLFKRVKERRDTVTDRSNRHGEIEYRFDVADDVNGHYQVSMIEITPYERGRVIRQYRVIALKFNLEDISRLFQLSGSHSSPLERPSSSTGGRPAVADWESAAIEMARRFYVGDLKPSKVGDVQRVLTEWLAAQDVHPSPTTLRDHAKRYFDAFLTWESD